VLTLAGSGANLASEVTAAERKPVTEKQIREAASLLCEAAPEATIILFGSHAGGSPTPSSDLDFLVVKPEVTARRREMVRLTDALRPLRLPTDVLVTSRQTFAKWRDTPGTVMYEAAHKGRVLHVGG